MDLKAVDIVGVSSGEGTRSCAYHEICGDSLTVSKCRAAGCGDDFATVLWALLFRYEDVFRLSLDRDPLADVAPLRVTLKAGAESVRCKARRYSKEQRDFMAKHVEELQAACNVEAL
ncbi:hypothetical protein DYB34_011922 [Aphanomyces astaci]|uniref:Uncharacterized protein n=1 Tax=Aphanomyces astaci TaxID=112090 RepID=A0A397EI43_APHAT|nr:hypothetical protein DYB34_011922 [Aphanomyces astaci]RHY91904.1 hypothetical protein DYB31_007747 [Aphanomyces astaci]